MNLQLEQESQDVQAIVAAAQATARFATNRLVAKRATALLNEFEQALRRVKVEQLPPLHALELDDHSLLFEWVLPGRRAGITIDPNPAQSGWFLLADDANGKCETWGYLASLDFAAIIQHIQQGIALPSL
jgi:hypothetical protein